MPGVLTYHPPFPPSPNPEFCLMCETPGDSSMVFVKLLNVLVLAGQLHHLRKEEEEEEEEVVKVTQDLEETLLQLRWYVEHEVVHSCQGV